MLANFLELSSVFCTRSGTMSTVRAGSCKWWCSFATFGAIAVAPFGRWNTLLESLLVRMNGYPWRPALEVAPVSLMAYGKVPLMTSCLIACSDSVCGRGRWHHLVLYLLQWFIGRLNVTCWLGPSWSLVAMWLIDSLDGNVIDYNAPTWLVSRVQ